jgi:S-DNA-T family DNA segregation ATPase FtsK/SpoIIIE
MENLNNEILQTAHTLIAGATGCGKSVLIHHAICDAISRPLSCGELFLIDLKRGVELCDYEGLPHVSRFAITVPEALVALDDAITIMQRRLDTMRALKRKMYDGRDLWIVIDELGFLLQSAKKEALKRLTIISQQGRAARVHLILATQNPSRAAVPAVIQQNMTLKVALHCTTAIESKQVVGMPGAESLPKHGTALVWSEGYVEQVEVPMIDDSEKDAAIEASRSAQGAAEILRLRAI